MTETLNREYFWNDVETQNFASLQDDPRHAISFDADTIANALVNIYQKKYGNGRELEPTLFEKTKEILGGAVNKGWNAGGSPATDRNSAFIDALRHNTDVFSAFRTHKMQSDIAAQLLDSKGRLKPFGQFVKDVKPYVTHQNRAWLQTEYDTAVLRAHQAADWKQFEAEKDVLPNLEWLPSTSPHPGEDHRPYWGTVLPIDHKFWNDHRPGDRWNCKCRLRNTDKEPTAAPAETVVKNLQPSKGLESNPGKTGEIFSNKHPYFPENCGVCPFNKGVGKLFAALVGGEKHCGDCVKVDEICNKNEKKAAFIQQRRQEYEQYKNDPDYVDVDFDTNTGAVKAWHKDHKNGDPRPYLTHLTANGSGFKSLELEKFCVEQLFKMGNSVIGLPEGLPKPCRPGETLTFYTALDILLNGVRMEIRSITKNKGYYYWPLLQKNEQLKNWNVENPNDPADSVMLYFHDPAMFSRLKVKDGITHYLNKGELYKRRIHNYIKHVYCVVSGVMRIYKFDVK